jgi:hypothetical protein
VPCSLAALRASLVLEAEPVTVNSHPKEEETMRNVFMRLSRRGGALALVVLAAIGVGAAVAAIPSADGTIHGCANRATGALRAIDVDANQTCNTRTEAPLNWTPTAVRTVLQPEGVDNIATTPTEVARLDGLKPGASYYITSTASLIAGSGVVQNANIAIHCGLFTLGEDPSPIDPTLASPGGSWNAVVSPAPTGSTLLNTLHVDRVVTILHLRSPDSIRLMCTAHSANAPAGQFIAATSQVRITAIPVTSIESIVLPGG